MKYNVFSLVFIFASVFCVHCGDSKKSTTVVGNITFSNTTSNDAGTASLTKLATCKRDPDLGIFDFEASSEDGMALLKFRVKGFKSTMETYTCKQADDNRTGTSLGGKYDTCFVSTRVAASPSMGPNAYSMYREEAEKNQSFTYSGTCQIQFSEVSPKAKAKIVCNKMIQTVLGGTTRNPISESVTGDLTAEIDCGI